MTVAEPTPGTPRHPPMPGSCPAAVDRALPAGAPRRLLVAWVLALLAISAPAGAQPPPAEAVQVSFELNDAQVKGRALAGVEVRVLRAGGELVASGQTGADGRFTARVAPGTYEVGYRLEGYVPYTSEATEIRGEGQLVTVSLSRMVEATEAAARDVRIILNWGSQADQVRDADSHLACACGDPQRHVYFRNRRHQAGSHTVELDVDDTDWGGPETITLTSPAPGRHLYWVHDYSGPPAVLGRSELVVRVLIGGEERGEFRVYRGLTRRAWRPFKWIEVSRDGRPTLVRFTEDEVAEGQDLAVPAGLQPPDVEPPPASMIALACPAAVLVIGLAIWLARRRRRR